MKEWIEGSSTKEGTYILVCPVCGFCYSPATNQDGTISASSIYKSCPCCSEKLADPAPDKRW